MLYLLNSTIITGEGHFACRKITEQHAKSIMAYEPNAISAIGHEATAQAFSTILGTAVPVNRIQVEMETKDRAICLKVKGRLPEGSVLGIEQLNEIGFEIFELVKYDPNWLITESHHAGQSMAFGPKADDVFNL